MRKGKSFPPSMSWTLLFCSCSKAPSLRSPSRPASSSPPPVAGFRFAFLRAAPPLHRLPPPASLRAGLQRTCILPARFRFPVLGPLPLSLPPYLLSQALFITRFRRNEAPATSPASSRCSFVALSLSASSTASPTQAGTQPSKYSCPIRRRQPDRLRRSGSRLF